MHTLLATLLLATAPAEGAEPTPVPEEVEAASADIPLEATTTGYVDTRFTWAHAAPAKLMPLVGVPALANISEGNFQGKLRFGEPLSVNADASLFFQWAGLMQVVDETGREVQLPVEDASDAEVAVVVSELYAAWEATPHLQLTLGKKRVVWGSGLAVNPTDLLNPPKDPTDPAGQRAGAWLARVDLPFERFTVSAVGAAKVLRQRLGLPTALITYPDDPTDAARQGLAPDDRDDESHWAAAARLYALVDNTDVTLTYHFTHLYNDAFRNKSRVGLSLSRTFGPTEVHLEALFQTGSSRLYVDPACAGDAQALAACVSAGTAPLGYSLLEDGGLRTKALVGGRYFFEDNATLSAEYYFNGDGYDSGSFARFLGLTAQARRLVGLDPRKAAALVSVLNPGGISTDPGAPQKFSFEPMRRHYLFLTYSKPQVADDFVLGASAVVNLSDLSGALVPQVSWSAREWLTLTASGSIPLPGLDALATEVEGLRLTEAGLSASDWRAWMSARLHF
jgi:hypothetical protein